MALRVSIRIQLLRLVLAVALPLAALLAWTLYSAAQADARHAREQVYNLASITASDTARFLVQVQDVLNGLAERPAVSALDLRRCDPALEDFRALTPRFANVVTLALDGTVVCSAQPNPRGARANPDNFLRRMRGPGELTVGKAAPGVITGKWVVPIGWPLLDSRGKVAGAVVLPVDLVNFPVLPGVANLPANSVVGLVALDGTVLARSLEAERYVGTNLSATSVAIREKDGAAEAMGVDGILRLQGFTPVPGTDWIAVASMPASEIYAGIRKRTVESALVTVAALCVTLLLGLRLSRAIAEPVTAMAAASEGVDARLRASESRLAAVILSAMDAIITVNEGQEILIFNPAAEKMFGFSGAEMIGRHLDVLLPERFRATHRRHIDEFGKAGITNRAMGKLGKIVGLRASGAEFPIEASISHIGESPGKLFTVILRDVTDREQAEQSLRALLARQRRLLQRLQETEENERRRINRELHDRVGQGLSMLNLSLDLIRADAPSGVARRMDDAQKLVADTTAQIRNLMADLHPPALDDFGLLAALQTLCTTLTARTGIALAVAGSAPAPRLPRTVEMALFRIAEGALGNCIKHAQASRIEVTLAATSAQATLTVADDGRGFEAGGSAATAHWGLTIMRERAEAIGARFHVQSSPGGGTRVSVEAAIGEKPGGEKPGPA